MTSAMRSSVGRPLHLGVERDGRLIEVTATPASGKDVTVDGQQLENRGYLGVEIKQATAPVGLLAALGDSFTTMWQVTDQEVAGIAQTFSPHGVSSLFHQVTNTKAAQSVANNPGSAPRPVSIVGIANLGAQSERAGLAAVLMLLIAINIVFGILNLLPMIPLDGGHVAIAAYEWVRTKKGAAVLPGRHHEVVPRGCAVPRAAGRVRLRRHLSRHHPPAPAPALTAVELSPTLLSPRRPTRRITLGGVPIGDGAPVTVQSMTTTKTADVEGTLAQIYALATAGADIVRCTCNEEAAAEGLAHIVPARRCPSWPTSTSTTRWRWPPSRRACRGCG